MLSFVRRCAALLMERASMDCAILHQRVILPRGEISRDSFPARGYTAPSFSTPL